MSKPAEIEAMVRALRGRVRRLDILVNNAGIQHVANGRGLPGRALGRDHRHQPQLGLPHHAPGLPGMKQAQLGPHHQRRLGPRPGGLGQKSAYVAAKHGIVGLTKAAALENATTGVTVNAICPGWVLTPLVQKQVDARAAADGIDNDEAKRRLLAEKQPSLQFTTPEQLAELAVFLCSPPPTTSAAWPGRRRRLDRAVAATRRPPGGSARLSATAAARCR
jgi:3-hydroxybutyrate dehydrogenase